MDKLIPYMHSSMTLMTWVVPVQSISLMLLEMKRFHFNQIWRAEKQNLFLIGRDKEVVLTDSVWLRWTGQMCAWWWVCQPKILKHPWDWQKHLEGIVNGIDAWAKVMKNEFTAPHVNNIQTDQNPPHMLLFWFYVLVVFSLNTC